VIEGRGGYTHIWYGKVEGGASYFRLGAVRNKKRFKNGSLLNIL
jgi:hypothetical protein